jgi:hypothetical protein
MTRRKIFAGIAFAIGLILAGSIGALAVRAGRTAQKSPHGFNAPQCTWWVDRHCAENGWILNFNQDHGRDAWLWPKLLENCSEISAPQAGCIVVFAPWYPGSVGHVAYVESVDGDRFEITHANYKVGPVVANEQGADVRRVAMRVAAERPGFAQFVESGGDFRVTFLEKK